VTAGVARAAALDVPGAARRALRHPVRAAAVLWRRMRATLGERARGRADARFLARAAALASPGARCEDAETVVAFCHSGFLRHGGMHALLARRLTQRGALPLFLLDDVRPPALIDPALRALEGSMRRGSRIVYERARDTGSARRRWDVDLACGQAVAEGIDFGPALLGALRRDFRCYRPDFDDPAVRAAADALVASADVALDACIALRSLARAGRRVRVAASELNYVPGGIFNHFCARAGRDDGMEFVDFGDAYAHFFKVGAAPGSLYQAANITRDGGFSRLDVDPEAFEAWRRGVVDAGEAREEAEEILRQDRTARPDLPAEARALLERVRAHRAGGGRVAGLFGHLAFDLGGLHDDGPAHRDMADWLDDTLAALAGSSTLVLVKPHIAEGRYKANRAPLQLFSDLATAPAAPNVVWLDPLWFNAHQLFPHLDLGIVWRSSVALELTLSGIPCVVAGRETYYQRVMDLPAPADRADYRRQLAALAGSDVSPAQRERAALLLKFIPRTFLSLPYVGREGGPAGPFSWNEAALARLRAEGDGEIDRAVDVLLAP
jgi:hypothetical protein